MRTSVLGFGLSAGLSVGLSAGLSAAASPLGKTVEIAPGVNLPTIGLGTCCGSDPKVGLAPWLEAGGISIDTAFDYSDQRDIAAVLKAKQIPRDSVFITTKVPAGFGNATDCDPDPEITMRYVRENLAELGVDQVDLVLIHCPCSASSRAPTKNGTASNNALYKGAEMALAAGLTRSIGISNYRSADIDALDYKVTPAVNQCRMGINTAHDDDSIAYCQAHGITYQSYQIMDGCPFGDKDLAAIAAKHSKSQSQVCLRWVLDRGCAMAVGTGSNASLAADYAKENLDIYDFSLTADEVALLNTKAKATE